MDRKYSTLPPHSVLTITSGQPCIIVSIFAYTANMFASERGRLLKTEVTVNWN